MTRRPIIKYLNRFTCLTVSILAFACLGSATLGSPAHVIPLLPASYAPGNPSPAATGCTFFYPDLDFEYCAVGRDIYLSTRGGIIQHVSIMVYGDDIKAGDLLAAWGAPESAIYYSSGSAMLYWVNKAAYISTSTRLSVYSRIGFLAFGPEERYDGSWPVSTRQPWRGFWQK